MDLPQKYGTTLKNLALASDRFGVSDRAASAIAMAILTDLRIKNENDKVG